MSMLVRSGTLMAQEGRPIRAVLTTSEKAADGYALDPLGCNLSRYRRNPVLLLNHKTTDLPVGRVVNIEMSSASMTGELQLAKSSPRAQQVEALVREGVLSAVSIGFRVDKAESGGKVTAWELLECSLVSVPMDAAALVYDRASRSGAGGRVDPAAAARLLGAFDQLDQAAVKRFLDGLDRRVAETTQARVRRLLPGVLAERLAGRR